MPNFQIQLDGFLRNNASNSSPSYAREDKFFDLVSRLIIPKNVRIIKTSDYWCSRETSDGCLSFPESQILMADEDHLGLKGSEIFGSNFVTSKIFNEILNE
jgi:hypothetical protein